MLCMFSLMVNFQVNKISELYFCLLFFFSSIANYSFTYPSCLNAGSVYGSLEFHKLTFSQNVKLRVGNNKISLLSITVGLPVSSLEIVTSLTIFNIF
jgi:hypothetical protein